MHDSWGQLLVYSKPQRAIKRINGTLLAVRSLFISINNSAGHNNIKHRFDQLRQELNGKFQGMFPGLVY